MNLVAPATVHNNPCFYPIQQGCFNHWCYFVFSVNFMSAVCRCLLVCVRNERQENSSGVEQDILETFDEQEAEKVGRNSHIMLDCKNCIYNLTNRVTLE